MTLHLPLILPVPLAPLGKRLAARTLQGAFFNVGDPILYGHYKNKRGIIRNIGVDVKGNPIVEIEPVPKGRKQNKVMQLFKIWHDPPPALRVETVKQAEIIGTVPSDPVRRLPQPIWVNVFDDCPPEICVEVDFPTDHTTGAQHPHPLDTYERIAFIRWLQASVDAVGYVTRVPEARGDKGDWEQPPLWKGKVAHIENAFYIENPHWPGQSPIAPWDDKAHSAFIEAILKLFKNLGSWRGIPLNVSCES